MEHQEQSFEYTYSAPQQEEVKKIREKYLVKEPTKLEQLRRLDESVTRRGSAVAIALGILSSLVLGFGMCCTMVWEGRLFFPGIVIGCIGIVGVCLVHPLYTRITNYDRQRIAPEILRLTEELMSGQS